jgi:hypothetical protein
MNWPTRLLATAVLLVPASLLFSPWARADAGAAAPSRQVLTRTSVLPYLGKPSGRLDRWTASEAALAQVPSGRAAGPRTRATNWSFIVAPYGWLAGTGGTITTNGEEQDFDMSFDDLFDLTTGGFQIYGEARYKRVFHSFDGTWATLGHGEGLARGRIDFEVQQTIISIQAGYRLIGGDFGASRPCACPHQPGAVALDAYVGARYWRTDLSLNINLPGAPPVIPPRQFSGSSVDDWVEPLIGARFGLGLTPKWGMGINGNIGGFGIGDAADFTWTLSLMFNWQFARHWSLGLGWRTQSVHEMSGSGANRNGSDITTTGPIVGLAFNF